MTKPSPSIDFEGIDLVYKCKIIAKVYRLLWKDFCFDGVNTNWDGEIKKFGDTVVVRDDKKRVPLAINNAINYRPLLPMSIEHFEYVDQGCVIAAEFIADELKKSLGAPPKYFAGQALVKDGEIKFIYGYRR